MMRGLAGKAIRETWGLTLACAIGAFLIEMLLTIILPRIQGQLPQLWGAMPFMRDMMSAMLGIQLGPNALPHALAALLWVHPLVQVTFLIHVVTMNTRFPVAELDRGTIDVLLSLPVSRWRIYVCESAVSMASVLIVIAAGIGGHELARSFIEGGQYPPAGLGLALLANAIAFVIAVGGMTRMFASIGNRRGRAISAVVGILIASTLLVFIAQWWPPAKHVTFLSILEYYRPAQTLTTQRWPLGDIAVLTALGLICWIIGAIITTRRRLCTT